MANFKDINADLGTQTIEGTSPPTAVEAEIVMPDGSSRPIPTADDLDAQLAALMAEADAPDPAPTEKSDEPSVFAMPPSSDEDELDAQLAALMAEADAPDRTVAELDEINAKIDDILAGTPASQNNTDEPIILTPPAEPSDGEPIILTPPPAEPSDDEPIILTPPPAEPSDDEPIILTPPPAEPSGEEPVISTPRTEANDAVEFAESDGGLESREEAEKPKNNEAEEARAMLEQAMKMMEEAQAAQRLAREQMQEAAKAAAAPTPPPAPQSEPSAATRELMLQAQMMLQQAQEAQMQAQQAAQAAQLQAQAFQASATHAAPAADPYSSREVDRLKSELDGMRDLVNKLTFTISQIPGGAQHIAQMPQMPPMYYATQQTRHDGEEYRKLETELEKMRRDIMEKDLRDREKELDRRQKEAEVKDIRPEMVQMSDSRDIAPLGGMNPQSSPVGGEYIPLANGVYYSVKDKQVYVMTPASNAAAASPTIEPKRPAAARPAPKRRAVPHRRPMGMHRRPAPRRPGRPRR